MTERPVDLDCWWSELYPAAKVSRQKLVGLFAEEALKQSGPRRRGDGLDKATLARQVNGFSVTLAECDWAKKEFTPAGLTCMTVQAAMEYGDSPEELSGWARVLDVCATICNPLAFYVLGYYARLQALRPPIYRERLFLRSRTSVA